MRTHFILGIAYHVGTPEKVVQAGISAGFVVIPSAPVMVRMGEDSAHRDALLNADLAITDSGLMVLLWRFLAREKLVRVSGLEYLKLLLGKLKELAPGESLAAKSQLSICGSQTSNNGDVIWIMPNIAARDRNIAWLQAEGHRTTAEDCYLAPHYASSGPLIDRQLLDWVWARQPRHIIIALGGGVQERLGYFIKQGFEQYVTAGARPPVTACPIPSQSGFKPSIHCVGAAIGFLSGEQVRIPMWVDYLYLGWLWRICSAPTKFFPRYWKATRLVGMMWRYREKAPELQV